MSTRHMSRAACNSFFIFAGVFIVVPTYSMNNEESASIERSLRLAPEAVWACWSSEEKLSRWIFPDGMSAKITEHAFVEGGTLKFSMPMPDGTHAYGAFLFTEIVSPELVAYDSVFLDESGKIVRAPGNHAWPMRIATRFEISTSTGGARIRMRWMPVNASGAEQNAFREGAPMIEQMWGAIIENIPSACGAVD